MKELHGVVIGLILFQIGNVG